MLSIKTVLLAAFLAPLFTSAWAGNSQSPAEYTVSAGEVWNFRTSDGAAARTPDRICKTGASCYPIEPDQFQYRRVERTFGLRHIDYDELKTLQGVTLSNDKVILPAELGSQIFRIAKNRELRKFHHFDWPHHWD